MSTEKLAFLQNFYTDVTLYVPAETAAAPAASVAAAPAQAPAPTASAARPAPTAAAAPGPGTREAADSPAPARTVSLPSTGFVKPSAGLERLTSRILSPPVAAAPEPAAPVPAPVVPPGVAPASLTPFSVAGSNREGVVLLVRVPAPNFIKLHRNVFLNKMLQALGLVMEDVLLVNVEGELPVALASLRQQLAATHIIAFGKNLLDVTIRNTQIYEPVLFPNLNLAYLASATIELVEYDVSLKKRLWPGLQAMFLR